MHACEILHSSITIHKPNNRDNLHVSVRLNSIIPDPCTLDLMGQLWIIHFCFGLNLFKVKLASVSDSLILTTTISTVEFNSIKFSIHSL